MERSRDITSDDSEREEALYRRFRGGDEQALRALFARHAGLMRARVLRQLPSSLQRRISVADILQDARMIAYERRETFESRGPGSFRRWILGIVDNKMREAVRRARTAKRAAHREMSRGMRRSTLQFAAQAPSPSEFAMRAESADLSRKAIEALSEDDRTVLRLAFYEQLSLREAAERMGRSHAAVKKLYGRALIRFRRVYEALAGGDDDEQG